MQYTTVEPVSILVLTISPGQTGVTGLRHNTDPYCDGLVILHCLFKLVSNKVVDKYFQQVRPFGSGHYIIV